MKSIDKYIKNNLLLNDLKSYISEVDLDIDVFNYINLFDDIPEEPIYKDDKQFVIYVSKKNKIKKLWIEHNSERISKMIEFDNLEDIIKNII